MNRRTLLAAALAGLSLPVDAAAQPPALRTRWTIRTSEGFDALAFLGPLTGDPFYAKHYAAELDAFRPRLPAEALEAIGRMDAAWDARGNLMWPLFTLIFSGGPDATLDDLLTSLDAAERVLKPPFQASVYWNQESWDLFIAQRDDLRLVLHALDKAAFNAFRRERLDAAARKRRAELAALLTRLDVIAEQERLLGRTLDPKIEVNLLWFCKPHGVKIQGQRFLAHVAQSDRSMVLTAAHEMLHPPFDMQGPVAKACYAVLEQDRLLTRILAEKDKATGYNSLQGILDEDTCQALDQIIQERLGFATPAKERWSQRDQGMHVLAAGLYGLMKADGYDRTGGVLTEWMMDAAKSGRLSPPILHPMAASVLERPVDQLWVTPAKT